MKTKFSLTALALGASLIAITLPVPAYAQLAVSDPISDPIQVWWKAYETARDDLNKKLQSLTDNVNKKLAEHMVDQNDTNASNQMDQIAAQGLNNDYKKQQEVSPAAKNPRPNVGSCPF